MKPRIYSIAAMAFVKLTFYSMAGHAQQAPAPAQAPTPPQAPQVYTYQQGSTYSSPNVYYYNSAQSTDTAYTRKMRKLQEQQRALSREMADLNREQARKNGQTAREQVSKLRQLNRLSDSSFSRSFNRSFTRSFNFNFDSDANLDKKVQSGEVKEKSKTYTKSYPADGNDKLQIDNRYGKITVNTWNKNEFKVDVQIKSYANNDDDAQKLLDQTSITDGKDNNLVNFTTVINTGSNNNFWGTMTTNGKTTVRKTIVTYTVYMPIKSAVSITNRYGAIDLPTLEGKVTINNTYGGLVAKSLTNNDNVINVRYGNANIGNLTGSDISVSYGSLNLLTADKLNAVINYGPAKIGKLTTGGTINVHYGDGLEINDVGKNVKALTVNTNYAPIKLGSLTNADFDVTVHYADFIYDNGSTSVTNKTPEDEKHRRVSTKNYKGHVGKGSTDKVITVKSNYGTVKFD